MVVGELPCLVVVAFVIVALVVGVVFVVVARVVGFAVVLK